MKRRVMLVAATMLVLGGPSIAETGAAENRILQTAMQSNEAYRVAMRLADDFGPRLTGSPQLAAAQDWLAEYLREIGLADVRFESFPFGRGWAVRRVEISQSGHGPIVALPLAWSPGTPGQVEGLVQRVALASEADLSAARGKLRGRILMLEDAVAVAQSSDAETETALAFRFERYALGAGRVRRAARDAFHRRLAAFLKEEAPLAIIQPSDRMDRSLHVEGDDFREAAIAAVPRLVIAADDYNRMLRQEAAGKAPVISIDVAVDWSDGAVSARNLIADIPGTDAQAGMVMVGAHLDSWHAGRGAADNAAGVGVVVEALRILKTAGVKPRRAIRLAIWAGEEQLMLGSADYVRRHVATRPDSQDPAQRALPPLVRIDTGEVRPGADFSSLQLYVNVDDGGGRITGFETAENLGLLALARNWLAPIQELGVIALDPRRTFASDHIAFDLYGIPTLNAVQARTPDWPIRYHSALDVPDYLDAEALRQSATVLASLLLQAADADLQIPRKPLESFVE